MPAEDVVKTQEIAALRIHVERAINKVTLDLKIFSLVFIFSWLLFHMFLSLLNVALAFPSLLLMS